MIIFFKAVCLVLTLCVLQKYITTGTNSSTHRLFPLVLGLIGTYNFYEIVATITGATEVFVCLKDLLLLQMLHLLLFYALDFLHVSPRQIVSNILFLLLLIMDVMVVMQYDNADAKVYERTVLLFVLWYAVLIVGLMTYAYIRLSFSKREHHVTNIIYISFLLPALALFLAKLQIVKSELLMPAALACTCACLYYLLDTYQLVDTLFILQEQQYDTAALAMLSFDADFYFLGANKAAKDLFQAELHAPGKAVRPEPYLDNIRSIAHMQEQSKTFEHKGRYYKCQMNTVYYHEQLKGYNLMVIDITEQKNETKLMALLKEEAEDKTALKSRFLATMSHDLRSPLHAIIGISDILAAKREISEKNRTLLFHIKRAGENLMTQVDAILDYSKLESGKFSLTRQAYNLDSMLEELAHMSVINLQSKQVLFTLKMMDEHPRQLLGDEMRVREIIQNLLTNAAKYTKEGEIVCELSCHVQPEAKRAYITCCVRDTGIGMSKKQLEHIFDEYVSFANGRTTQGAGLGLCIVKQLAERMGGSVSATSDGISGSTVTASFYQEYTGEELCPAFELDGDTILRQTTAFHYNVYPAYIYPKAKVLVAEDMRINQEIFREFVMPWKFEVAFADDGKKAVEMARTENYQMIFLDQMMPEMMGDEAASEIRKFTKCPLIMTTANLSDDLRDEYLEKGFNDFLPKPIDIQALQKIIEQHMPHAYRQVPTLEAETGITQETRSKANRRILKTFVDEVAPLGDKLPGYVTEDLEMFRVKVHGIKGTSRQIGRLSLSEQAEIMEMAAKTQNLRFIDEHMRDFQNELEATVKEVREELSHIPVPHPEERTVALEKETLFARLKNGFAHYELDEIEESIAALAQVSLTEEEQELLDKAKVACDEMDYEAGSALFS